MTKFFSVSATNGTITRHIGSYADKKTAIRVIENIELFVSIGWVSLISIEEIK